MARINARKKASSLKKSRRKHIKGTAGQDGGEDEEGLNAENSDAAEDEAPAGSSGQQLNNNEQPAS